MKTLISFSLTAAILLIQSYSVYSQNQTDISKIIPGKAYKIVLFDETEILGTIISMDSANIGVKTKENATVIIPRDNILYYSSNLTSNKYKFSLSLLSGVSLISGDYSDYPYPSDRKINPHINISDIHFFSGNSAIKFDAGFTYVKWESNNSYPSYYDPNYQNTYEGGDMTMFSFKVNLLYGDFRPSERFMFYGSVGVGMHYTSRQSVTEHYWSIIYPDTTLKLYTSTYPSTSEINAVFSLGASFGYRFTKNLGLKIEFEYNLVTGNYLMAFFGRTYFPVRAGIFYIL